MFRKSLIYRAWSILGALLLALTVFVSPIASLDQAVASEQNTKTYINPLPIKIPGGGMVETCADPSIIHSQTPGDTAWYMYCTTDPLNGADKNGAGDFNFHLIPVHKSVDLVHWTYAGDVFSSRPGWVNSNAGLWAPDIHFFNGKYYLYYTASDTSISGGGSAIGVAISDKPSGPWSDSGGPVVEPHQAPCCPGSKRWVFDPFVMNYQEAYYIFYGSYFGGISARKLTSFTQSDPSTQVQVAIDNKFEGTFIYKHDGYYYFFGSATDCCRGPLTGYSVFTGRSLSPFGPYLDKEGVPLGENQTDQKGNQVGGRVGGTPVISMNGNRWVGTGHNAVFRDFDGQDWFLYHAVDRFNPYFTGAVGFTKRPALMDPLDWVNGWPTVRGGFWASDTPQPAPAAQPGEKDRYKTKTPRMLGPGTEIKYLSDEFNSNELGPQWSWVRKPASSSYGVSGGTFRFDTQAADLYQDINNASVLTEASPSDDYVVETKVKLNVPAGGCCFNFVQAGLVIYGNDDNFIKLATVSIFNTRQTEFAKELFPVQPGYPRYGNTVVGPPGEWTYLRIVKQTNAVSGKDQEDARDGNTGRTGEDLYTAFTSHDGSVWTKGGTWTHALGPLAKIGLISMGGSGFTANFDYVHVYRLKRDEKNEE